MTRRGFLGAGVALLALLAVPGLGRAQAAGPDAPVRAFVAGLDALGQQGSAAPYRQRYDRLAPVFDRSFDLPAILRTVVGLGYDGIAEADRTRLLAAFRAFSVCSWVSNFSGSDRVTLTGEPPRESGADRVVPAKVGDSALGFVVRQTGQGWRIVDVLEDGSISQAAVQRSDFRSLLRNGPGALIDSLTRRVATLSGGAVTP
jgi:phospholipid transport system substrate-binding protein